MVDFNGFDKGVIGKKLPSDSTLNQMKKSELIELLHLAESNHRVLAEAYKIAVDTSKCKSCPLTLDEKDRRQVRTEAIKEFAKWSEQKGYLSTIEHDEDEDSEGFIVYHEYVTSMRAEDVCEEYFKEQNAR